MYSPEMRRQAVAEVTRSSIAEVAARRGISPSSLRRWAARTDLADRPRSGRPAIQSTANQVVEALVGTAGARISGADYSTRALAEATGLSQSIVSRAMRELTVPIGALLEREAVRGSDRGRDCGPGPCGPGANPPEAVPRSPRGTGEITRVIGGFPFVIVGIRGGGADPRDGSSAGTPTAVGTGAERPAEADAGTEVAAGSGSASSPHSQAVSARRLQRRIAGIVAALRSAGVQRWAKRFGSEHRQSDPAAVQAVLGDANRLDESFIVFDPLGETAQMDVVVAHRTHGDFDAFVDALKRGLVECHDIPGSLLDLIAGRVRHGFEGVWWQEGRPVASVKSSRSSDSMEISSWLPKETRSITEHLAIALREEIIDSGYQPGDRINPRLLSRRMGVPRSSVDAALRRMVDDELLDGSRGGARIPLITTVDVLDLYAARVALGEVLLRSLALRPKRYFVPVQLALRQVEASAATKSGIDVEDADLHFQQELARASGLRQSARVFESLTLRLRLFISILQLDYSPASDRILSDDGAILRALSRGDAQTAINAWRGKVDNAVRHMAGLLARRHFDQELWSQLTQRLG